MNECHSLPRRRSAEVRFRRDVSVDTDRGTTGFHPTRRRLTLAALNAGFRCIAAVQDAHGLTSQIDPKRPLNFDGGNRS